MALVLNLDLLVLVCSVGASWTFAFYAYRAWWFPSTRARREWIRYAVGALIVEQIRLGSMLFAAIEILPLPSLEIRLPLLIVGFLFCCLFPAAIALILKSRQLLLNFVFVLFSGWLELAASSDAVRGTLLDRLRLETVVYFCVVVVTIVIPVPRGGIDDEVRREAGIPGSGRWVSQPERALAALAIYFTAVGVIEIFRLGLPHPDN